ncbi:MAG: aspartate aminotransferase [Bdellovibrionaceae bacterium]|nr:aspartate aminotransferase [Pseudobdellovibrionaceae bacterium]|tara:strand:+ start:97344 stop:98540 length:1197 start_codon:yes stop_codon:yes gene_type:complete
MLSQRAKGLKPSPTLALAAKAKELKAEGKDVISLSVGEPDWDTFESVKKVGMDAIANGQTKYAPSNGTPEIRQAIADQFKNDFGIEYAPSQVTATAGAKFIVFAALQMLVDSGDEVLIPAPYWVSYPTMVELAGGIPQVVVCDKKLNFKLSAEKLAETISSKTKVIILNSPSNPTGNMYSEEEWKGIAQVLKDHPNTVILLDDIYNRLVFNERGLAPHFLEAAPELKDRTIVINGASKAYSMTGWRLGWALGPEKLIAAMNKYQSQSVSCASGFTLAAGNHALRHGDAELGEAVAKLKTRRDFVYEELSKVDGLEVEPPEGAFYIWPNVSSFLGKSFKGKKLETTREICAALLEDQMVVTVPGIEFGLDGYLRISYALEQDRMQEAIQRIKNFLSAID